MNRQILRVAALGAAVIAVSVAAQVVRERIVPVVHPSPAPAEQDQEFQPPSLPALPAGMTLEDIQKGDDLFHGRGGCFACHGAEAEGLPAAGSALTRGLGFIPPEWHPIDSLIQAGVIEVDTRSPIRMPARGARGDLTNDETKMIAAYVWAIATARGEPWAGGHPSHAKELPPGATAGTASRKP
jgi:cytochrome c5